MPPSLSSGRSCWMVDDITLSGERWIKATVMRSDQPAELQRKSPNEQNKDMSRGSNSREQHPLLFHYTQEDKGVNWNQKWFFRVMQWNNILLVLQRSF